tara:strand:+ start:44 stop:487 length:444 start_codon:yes stop_codon:yes gene_type:complete
MATQIVILNKDYMNIDNFHIGWVDKGKNWNDSWLPDTIHAVVYNNLPGSNEIQNKDATTHMMTGNQPLNATSDAVGSTTVADLLSWGETRKTQINSAVLDYQNYVENAKTKWIDDGNSADDFHSDNSSTSSYIDWSKSWIDFDENYS